MAVKRANNDDQLQRTRDEYDNREKETIKRKNQELKKAERRHQNEVRKLTEEYQNQLAEMQGRNREVLTEKDMKHQKNVEDIRNMHREQARKKLEEDSLEKRTLVDTYKNTLQKEKQVSAIQRDELITNQMNELSERDQQLRQISANAQRKATEAVKSNAEKLKASHQKEKTVIQTGRDADLSRKEKELAAVRDSYRDQLTEEARKNEFKEQHWQQKHYDTVRNYDQAENENQQIRGQTIKMKNENLKARYNELLDEKRNQLDENYEHLRDSVHARVNDQVRSRDSKISALKDKMTRDDIRRNQIHSLEKEHIVRDYEKRMGLLEQDKYDYIDEAKRLVHDRVENQRERNRQVAREADRNYKSQMNLITTQNREERKLLEEQQKNQLSHIKNQADTRVDKLLRVQNQNTRNLANTYFENLDVLKDTYQDKLVEQRDNKISEHMRLNQAMTKRVRGMEDTYQHRLENMQAQFEERLAAMREDHRKELRNIERNYKTYVQDREKGHKNELDSMEMKYEARIEAIQEQHEQDKKRTHKKHEEDMKALSNRLSNYSRKA